MLFILYISLILTNLLWPCDPQDAQIQQLKEQVSSMSSQNEQMQTTLTQQLSQIQQHKDQYNILKLKLGGFTSRNLTSITGNRCFVSNIQIWILS